MTGREGLESALRLKAWGCARTGLSSPFSWWRRRPRLLPPRAREGAMEPATRLRQSPPAILAAEAASGECRILIRNLTDSSGLDGD
jgi:hypothetical protein